MRKTLCLFVILFIVIGITFTSCQNSDEEINQTTSAAPRVEKYSIGECPDSLNVLSLFNGHEAITRSMDVPSKLSDYDFSSPYLLNIEGKEDNVYIIPAGDSANNEDFLIGVGTSKEIAYRLYFKRTSAEKYTLYNELKEPLFTVSYDEKSCLAVVTDVYGNDVPTIPVSRIRGSWFTAACSAAIAAGCYGLSAIGAVATAGASLGPAACSTVICLALC